MSIHESFKKLTRNILCGGKCGECKWSEELDSKPSKICDRSFEPTNGDK